MNVNELPIIELNEGPPPLDLTPEEVAALADEWFAAAHRGSCQQCGIPEDTPFTTKPALALQMLRAVVTADTLRLCWVTCDEAVGREPTFLDGVAALPRWYMAEVPHDTRLWLTRPATFVPAGSGRGRRPRKARLMPGEPAPQRVAPLAAAIPVAEWQPYLIQEGSKGPLVAEFACRRGMAMRARLPGPDVWIGFRRALGEHPDLQVYLSNAPAHTPVALLVRVSGMRWPIETALEESQGGLGMDHYEVRSWLGWHHHLTRCLSAHHCLVRARARVKKGGAGADLLAGAVTGRLGFTPAAPYASGGVGAGPVYPGTFLHHLWDQGRRSEENL